MNNKKEKKIFFSKEIDDSINGYSLVITFIFLGLALSFYPKIFGNVGKIVTYIFITIGILGFLVETEKYVKKYKIIGFDDIRNGIILSLVLLFAHKIIKIPSSWLTIIIIILKIVYIIFWLTAIYSICNGLLKIIYSIYNGKKNKKKSYNIKLGLKLIIDLLGLILVILQIINVIGEI